MSDFKKFRAAVQQQLDLMIATETDLFEVQVDKNDLWDIYLNSFPEGTNPIYKEQTEHDCNCCKQFIRDIGAVVALKSGSTAWDIKINDDTYQPVADALSAYVKQQTIKGPYRHIQKKVGTDRSAVPDENGKVTVWDHFYYELPSKFVILKHRMAADIGNIQSTYGVLERSLKEITAEAIEVVSELIDQNALYRGQEHKSTVTELKKAKKAFDKLTTEEEQTAYLWTTTMQLGMKARFKNSVIGTLLLDISKGTDLTIAVKSFELKVAPANYKRTTALITKGMITKAEDKVKELGLTEALHRRFAVTEDLTVNNVLFADRSAKKIMEGSVFDDLTPTKTAKPSLKDVTEVSIEDFVKNIVPKAESLELMVENRHTSNLVSLIAPTDPESNNILKWDNNFSWSYNGEVTDSIKERVKSAGGDVTGVLRFSIQWNEEGKDKNIDFDAHCKEPDGNLIYYGDKSSNRTKGKLDVDITNPEERVAVENITWPNTSKMDKGTYQFMLHNFSSRKSNSGFKAEVAFNGQTYSFAYDKPVRGDEIIKIANVTFDGSAFTIKTHLNSEEQAREVWGISTIQFHKVNMLMLSPNHWDEQNIGNKHWFFMLDKCINPEDARGFYNEFLRGDLTEHRKVFEVLSTKLKAPQTDNQLSGLGFSSTQKNSVVCKVSGAFNRMVKINF